MKFKVPKSKLLDALNIVQNTVSAKITIPVLSNVLIEAQDNVLTLTTTDTNMTTRCKCEAEVEEEGAITLPVKKLTGIVRELDDGIIYLKADSSDFVQMKCGSYKSKINALPVIDFPRPPTKDGGVSFTMSQELFRDMLKKTHYAASVDDSRPVLNGVLLNFADGKLTCVATDGRRLALYETELDFPSENNKEVVLPSRAIGELLRVLEDKGDIEITIKETQLILEFSGIFFACKLLSGAYPNYKAVVFSSCANRIEINREELLAVLRRIAVSTTPTTNAMRLTFGNNLLNITVTSNEVGEANDTVAIKYDGEEISMIFNPEFMMDPLKNLTSDVIYIELNNSSSPGLIKSDIPFLYVIMPLRV